MKRFPVAFQRPSTGLHLVFTLVFVIYLFILLLSSRQSPFLNQTKGQKKKHHYHMERQRLLSEIISRGTESSLKCFCNMLGICDASKWEQTTLANNSLLANSPISLGFNVLFWQKRKHMYLLWAAGFNHSKAICGFSKSFFAPSGKWLISGIKSSQGSRCLHRIIGHLCGIR